MPEPAKARIAREIATRRRLRAVPCAAPLTEAHNVGAEQGLGEALQLIDQEERLEQAERLRPVDEILADVDA